MNSTRKEDIKDVIRQCHVTASNMSIMNFEGLGTEDYENDSDKEIDIPIDPVWEAQQMHTFTAWCNAHLRKANMKIEVFEQDFRNGLRLMKLLEIISNDVLPPPDKGRMRFHKIANVNKALKFIEEKGVKLAFVGAEEIVDGNIKMTLGMLWTIILRFTIQDILVEDSSAKEGLLLWCKRKTHGYKNVRVDNFKNSFQNGLAFCALIHNHDSSLLDYNSLSPNDASHNLDLAFTVADENLDVPQMLSVEDMINNDNSDERSIMAYVSSYYHAFNRRDKIKTALNNINDIITDRIEADSCALDYEKISTDLLHWIEKMRKEFEDRKDMDESSQLLSKVKAFEQYKFYDKPTKICCHLKLQFAALQNLALKEKEELIKSNWSKMEKSEYIYEKHLSEQRQRAEHIANLLSKFEINYQVQRAWISNKIDQLISKDYEIANLCELRTMARLQETFVSNVGSQQPRTEKIVNIATELRRLHYKDMKIIDEKVDIIVSPWDTLGNLNEQRVESINIFLNAMVQIDDLQLDFAKRVTPLYNWIQQANQDLNDTFILHFMEEIKELITAQKKFKKTVDDALDELNYVKSVNDHICRLIKSTGIKKIPLNPYTDITINDAQQAWGYLEKSIPERDTFLRDSLAHQISITDSHNEFKKRIENIASKLVDLQRALFDKLSSKSSAEKKIAALQNLQEKLHVVTGAIKELDVVYQKLDSYSKIDNSKTILSYEQILATRDTLHCLIAEALQMSCNDQTDSKISNDIPRNKSQEYEACFRHFDRTNSGSLDPMQFRACLVSLGFPLGEDEKNDSSFDQLITEVDPDRSGSVSLRNYLDFMNRNNGDKGNCEQLVESFRILSNNESWISRDLISQELSSPVADYCLKNMHPYVTSNGDNGDIHLDYNEFVTRIYQSGRAGGGSGRRLTGATR